MDKTLDYQDLEDLIMAADNAAALVRLAHSDIFDEAYMPVDSDGLIRCTATQANALAYSVSILEDAVRAVKRGWYLAHDNAAKAERGASS